MQRLAVLLLVLLTCLPRSGAAQSTPDYPLFFPLVTLRHDLRPPPVKLAALLYDPVTSGEPDEAVQLYNPGRGPADLAGWSLSDGTRRAVFPSLTLAPGAFAWCAYNAPAFQASFGFPPDCEYGPDSGAGGPRLDGVPPRFSNAGGSVSLAGPEGGPLDLLVYKTGPVTWGWQGPTVSPWRGTGLPEEGQVLTRKRDEVTGQPLADTNTAVDWASDPADPVGGRRAWYPAWDATALRPLQSDTPASFRLALAPDIAFYIVRDVITAATTSVTLALYSFDHPTLADLLAERLAAGVRVTVLLEGAPAGGLDDQQRWAATRVAQAGGRVLYMSNHLGGAPRYRNQHAKVAIVDDRRLLLSTENWSPDSLPDDDKSDGTEGRRGVVLLTEQPDLVAHVRRLLDRDTDPRWGDLVAWNPLDTAYGPPTFGYQPNRVNGGTRYSLQAPAPLDAVADRWELVQSPENSLRRHDGLLGLVSRAGTGDQLLVQMLYEQNWWGAEGSSAQADPNPRLEAYLAAARRGAQVRLLLDSLFDDIGDPRSNRATCIRVNETAVTEGLDLQCRTANPTGGGIHNKLVLIRLSGEGYVHLGSLNGSEISHKLNREVALQFRSQAAYDYLARVFAWDWEGGR